MKKIRLILLFLIPLLVLAKPLKPAEEALRIKSSRHEYWWGEAYDLSKNARKPADKQRLKEQALADLVNRIRVHIFTEMQHQERETDGQLSSQSETSIRLSSAQYLSNVHYLEYKENKRTYFLAYLSMQDYERTQEEEVERIKSLVRSAQTHEKEGEFAQVESYLRAYLMAQTLGQNIQHEGMDLSSSIQSKILSLMQDLPLSAKVGAKDVWGNYPIEIISKNSRLSGAFEFEIPELGFKNLRMVDGELKIFYEGDPSKSKQDIELIISPDVRVFMQDNTLKDGAKALRMNYSRKLCLDFSEHINVDWSYESEGLRCTFSPVIKGLSIARLNWNFGDGTVKDVRDLIVTHDYAQSSSYQVTFEVNDAIQVSKTISLKTMPDIKIKPEPSIKEPEHPLVTKTIRETMQEAIEEATPELLEEPTQEFYAEPAQKAAPVAKASDEYTVSEFGVRLKTMDRVQELMAFLDTEKNQGNLVWGWFKSQDDPEGYWLVILDPDTGRVIDRLAPDGEGHRALSDQSRVGSLSEHFKGKLALYIYPIEED